MTYTDEQPRVDAWPSEAPQLRSLFEAQSEAENEVVRAVVESQVVLVEAIDRMKAA
jgi:hypothetical protein